MAEPATVREWTDILRRIRFGPTVAASGSARGVRGSTVRAVALMLASYADSDGTRVYPGTARIAVACEIDYRTAKRCVAELRHLGLITLVRPARRRTAADEYRLSLPIDLLDRVEVLTPAAMEREVERIRDGNRRSSEPAPTDPDDPRTGTSRPRTAGPVRGHNVTPQPVDNAAVRGRLVTVQLPLPGGPYGDTPSPNGGLYGDTPSPVRGQGAPPPTTTWSQVLPNHSDRDLHTDVTASRARSPSQDPISVVVEGSPAGRCPHGLAPGTRPDGAPLCALCRRAAIQPPEPAEPGAKVIQLRPRTA